MGGHEAGEVASRVTVETVCKAYYDGPADPNQALRTALRRANYAVLSHAGKDPALQGMGTTCTALALLRGGQAYMAHVGDSRLYMIRGGQIYHLTEDDSQVMDMVRRGMISIDEARQHEDRNILLRALGRRSNLEVAAWEKPMPVHAGDSFVLATDGLHDLVRDEEIRDIVESSGPEDACAALVELARSRGGYDNVTVAVLRVANPEREAKTENHE
jgi:protein phosphatase